MIAWSHAIVEYRFIKSILSRLIADMQVSRKYVLVFAD